MAALKIQLEEIAMANPTAIEVFDHLSKRQRTRDKTDLWRLEWDLNQENRHIDKQEFMKTFEMLEKAGLGVITRTKDVYKRPKFTWKRNLKEIASEALSRVNNRGGVIAPIKKREDIMEIQTDPLTEEPKKKRPGPKRKIDTVERVNVLEQAAIDHQLEAALEPLIQYISDKVGDNVMRRLFQKLGKE